MLRLGVAVQCAALAWLALRHGTSLDTLLFSELGTSEAAALAADRVLAAAVALAAAALLFRPLGSAAGVVALAFLLVAVATRLGGARPFADLSPLAHANRWLAPLAIAVLWGGLRPAEEPSGKRVRAGLWVLRCAVAATFLAHGWQALGHHPAFVDLLIGTARRWTDTAPPETTAHLVLNLIGAMDVAVAVLLLAARWPGVALWAAAWGLATLASRTVALGTEFLHESLIRAMNALAPLALWLLWRAEAAAPPTPPPRCTRSS